MSSFVTEKKQNTHTQLITAKLHQNVFALLPELSPYIHTFDNSDDLQAAEKLSKIRALANERPCCDLPLKKTRQRL